jgi:hypothetical protein
MNFSIINLTSTYVVFTILTVYLSSFGVAATPDYAIRILFNHGQTLPGGQTCNITEWDQVLATIFSAAGMRRRGRNLRMGGDNGARQLPARTNCDKACAGFNPQFCANIYPDCKGWTGRDLSISDAMPSYQADNVKNRNLVITTLSQCQVKVGDINVALNNLGNVVSAQCTAVMAAQRDFTCYDSNVCGIEKFRLWNADTDTVANENFVNGSSFCRSAFRFNVEAVGVPCVGDVDMNMYGPNFFDNTYEGLAPYVIFGQNGTNIYGKRLAVGNYTLTATPDMKADLTKTLTFNINNC